MNDSFPKPLIFLAFANEQGDAGHYLRDLPEEARRLRAIVEQVEQTGLCELILRTNATLVEILNVFQERRYRNRVVIFHYGGHAGDYGLLLEMAGRQAGLVDAEGLAVFLGQQGLRLVFLNGCSTQSQVVKLLEAGVMAVIATAQAIDDKVAMEFASRFYQGLAGGASVRRAYHEAEGAIQAAWGSGSWRALYWDGVENVGTMAKWPWILSERVEGAAEWSLMEAIHHLPYGRPRLAYEPETIFIPAGPFWMGSNEGEPQEYPQHQVTLPAYQIGKYPVTNREYAEFIRQTGHKVRPTQRWRGQIPPETILDHPVMGISWDDALSYCHWLTEQTGRTYSLPSEAQWEKAARGSEGYRYPWGDRCEPDRCNHQPDQIRPVNYYPPQSQYGCYDMVGNVREWTRSLWGERLFEVDPRFRYPWTEEAYRNDLTAGQHLYRVYRGGAAGDSPTQLRCSTRSGFDPQKTGEPGKRHGFRVAIILNEE